MSSVAKGFNDLDTCPGVLEAVRFMFGLLDQEEDTRLAKSAEAGETSRCSLTSIAEVMLPLMLICRRVIFQIYEARKGISVFNMDKLRPYIRRISVSHEHNLLRDTAQENLICA